VKEVHQPPKQEINLAVYKIRDLGGNS